MQLAIIHSRLQIVLVETQKSAETRETSEAQEASLAQEQLEAEKVSEEASKKAEAESLVQEMEKAELLKNGWLDAHNISITSQGDFQYVTTSYTDRTEFNVPASAEITETTEN